MMKKLKTNGNGQQASHAVQAPESPVQRHVRLLSTPAFKRKYRNIFKPDGDLGVVRVTLKKLEASQLNAPAALVRARGQHRFAGQLYGQVSGQVADMRAVRAILRRLLKPEAADRWLNTEIPALNQRKPMDVIRHGGVQQVIEALARVEEGISM